jgi:hypothetical protein
MAMGKFRRDQGVARNFDQINKQMACRFHAGQYLSIICAAVALTLAYAPMSKAQIVIGPSTSLANLTNGETIIVGDKAFTDFSISGDFSASQVTVTEITEDGNYGIRFGGLFLGGMAGADMILGYQVSVTNSDNLISSANMLFNGFVGGGTGEASVVEQVFTNTPPVFYGQFAVFVTESTSELSNSLPIIPPQSLLTISKDVSVEAVIPALSEISTIDQTFTQVPEPSTLALAAAGLSGLFLLRRRKH